MRAFVYKGPLTLKKELFLPEAQTIKVNPEVLYASMLDLLPSSLFCRMLPSPSLDRATSLASEVPLMAPAESPPISGLPQKGPTQHLADFRFQKPKTGI